MAGTIGGHRTWLEAEVLYMESSLDLAAKQLALRLQITPIVPAAGWQP